MTTAGERRRRACSDCLSWWARRHRHRATQRTWLCWDSPPEALAQPWPEIQASIHVGIALERQYCEGMIWLLSSVSGFLDPDHDDLYVRTAHQCLGWSNYLTRCEIFGQTRRARSSIWLQVRVSRDS